jgi:Galactosyltransferase
MNKVDGIILVLTCQKHVNTRMKQFKLPKDKYGDWQVVYVIGDLFLDSEYKMNGNLMTIKCEDSYIHLLKKLVLSLKYVYELYDIKDGVLRCGDDVIFNETVLQTFLESKKFDYVGKNEYQTSFLEKNITPEFLKRTFHDNFMLEYYLSHPEDFDNPQHNLKGVDISKYTKRPEIIIYPNGVIFYISNKSCKILIDHMENINYNIFHFDDFSKSYPYTIEDCGVAYILYSNKIGFIHNDKMYAEYPSNYAIGYHTNIYK